MIKPIQVVKSGKCRKCTSPRTVKEVYVVYRARTSEKLWGKWSQRSGLRLFVFFSCQNGWTPLHFAAKSGYLDTVQFLVESGASPKLECKEGKAPIQYAAADRHQEVVSFLIRTNNITLKLTEDRKVRSRSTKC